MRSQLASTTKRRRNDLSLVGPQAEPAISSISREDIERRAYDRFIARGYADGGDVDDWLEAERELLASHPAHT